MDAPTAGELLNLPGVVQAIEQAWVDSLPGDPAQRHEEGGWIYADVTTGAISIRRAPGGLRSVLDLDAPPVVLGSVVVATFHTHPNPITEGYLPGPSPADVISAELAGVPCLIRAEDGFYTTGPASRRGGMVGPPGYPA
jgi:hypothetical protein